MRAIARQIQRGSMSEREAIEQKIQQCRRFLNVPLDPLTTERLRALLAELELELTQLG
jgi:hypothetical protein